MLKHRSNTLAAAFAFCVTGTAFIPAHASAGDTTTATSGKGIVQTAPEKSLCDRIWDYPTIYKNDESAFFNEFRFVGRLHLDEYSIDSDRGYDQDWIVRRMRIGGKALFFHRHLTLHVETDFNPQSQFVGSPAYQRLTDAYIAWTFCDAAKLTVGKQSAKFTLDGSTSSNELITIDRNNVANNLWFPTEYISGVTLGGKIGRWQYNTGYFSGGTDTKEFGNFDAGHFGLFSVGYDFGKALGVKKALLRADYVYNDRNVESTATRPFENIGALVFQLDSGRWGFSAEVAGGTGYAGQSDVLGVTAMPWFNITDKLQAVVRYNYLASQDPRGVRLARYDSFVTKERGDEYHEIYGGLNYYVCGHRLKVQTGVSYVSLKDSSLPDTEYHAWQWTTGLRLSF
jgi:phosphate-selective porin OprO/OprP